VQHPRRPRFLPFILTGVVVGFAIGGALAVFGWLEDPSPTIASNYSSTSSIGYLGLLGALLFGLLAALVAVVVERRSDRS
jgi:hypothetical protein